MEKRCCPGIASMASRRPSPSITKSGMTRWSTERYVSRAIRRIAAVRRSRRGRWTRSYVFRSMAGWSMAVGLDGGAAAPRRALRRVHDFDPEGVQLVAEGVGAGEVASLAGLDPLGDEGFNLLGERVGLAEGRALAFVLDDAEERVDLVEERLRVMGRGAVEVVRREVADAGEDFAEGDRRVEVVAEAGEGVVVGLVEEFAEGVVLVAGLVLAELGLRDQHVVGVADAGDELGGGLEVLLSEVERLAVVPGDERVAHRERVDPALLD